jgi:hypothetical protein
MAGLHAAGTCLDYVLASHEHLAAVLDTFSALSLATSA